MKLQFLTLVAYLIGIQPMYSQLTILAQIRSLSSVSVTSVSSLSDSDPNLPACAKRKPSCNCSNFKSQKLDFYPNDAFGLDCPQGGSI
jgi:hypothetical protein